KARIDAMAEAVARERGRSVNYQVGTMIELPRASLRAGEIAKSAEFFSFGTNDLTQTTYGISRDDAASFLGTYVARGVLPSDPFVSIDREGVGELMRIGVERGRKARPKLKVGICGEHGGDPASVAFCHAIALDYVSCSPFRVPIARLAAAQAALGKAPAGRACRKDDRGQQAATCPKTAAGAGRLRRPFPKSNCKRRRPTSRPRRAWSIACSAGPAGWSRRSRSRCRCFIFTPPSRARGHSPTSPSSPPSRCATRTSLSCSC